MNRIPDYSQRKPSPFQTALAFSLALRDGVDKIHIETLPRIAKILSLGGIQRCRLKNTHSYSGRLYVPDEETKQKIEKIFQNNRRFRSEIYHGTNYYCFTIRKVKLPRDAFSETRYLKDEYSLEIVVDPTM